MGQKETKFFNADASGPTSANINRVSYYPETKILEVKFKNNSVYQYDDVSEKLWEEARKSESIGRFMTQNIKGVYSYRRI